MNITIPKSFLEEIQSWMGENDYECGPEGSEIYDKISKYLDAAEESAIIDSATL